MPGRVVIQWDKEDCEDLGIIKIDLLGLGMLAVLEQAIPLVRAHEGVEVDLAHIPADDPAVYAMLQKADTVGVFQIESRAQMATLPRMKPRTFYDLVVEVAIIRPGPIVGKMVHPYLDRRNGRAPVRYDHPSLEPILRRTLGVPLFQEQMLRIAMTVAGFSGGEAEELRRAMGFKRSSERMEKIEERLRAGDGAQRDSGRDRRSDRAVDHVVCAVRLSGIAFGQLRADRLCVGLSEAPPSGGVLRGDAQLLADGLLPSGDAGEGCAAPRRRDAADRGRRGRSGTARSSSGKRIADGDANNLALRSGSITSPDCARRPGCGSSARARRSHSTRSRISPRGWRRTSANSKRLPMPARSRRSG